LHKYQFILSIGISDFLYPRGDARRLSGTAAFYIAYLFDNQRFLSLQITDDRARQLELDFLSQGIMNVMVAIPFVLQAGDTPVCLPRMPLQL
jgi:hypothetical protein